MTWSRPTPIDLGTVTGRLTAEVAAGSMAGADAVFVAMQLPHDAASIGLVVSFINYLLAHRGAVGQRRHRRHSGCGDSKPLLLLRRKPPSTCWSSWR